MPRTHRLRFCSLVLLLVWPLAVTPATAEPAAGASGATRDDPAFAATPPPAPAGDPAEEPGSVADPDLDPGVDPKAGESGERLRVFERLEALRGANTDSLRVVALGLVALPGDC